MKTIRSATALVAVAAVFSACADSTGSTDFSAAPLESEDQMASYGVGLNMGRQIADTRDHLDRAAFMRGIIDALEENDQALTNEELQTALNSFSQRVQTAAAQRHAEQGRENAEAGAAYQAENGAREAVTTTESGLQYEVLREGEGATPTAQSNVLVHYRGTLIDGTEFDASYGGDPARFNAGGLIAGFTEALLMMQEGDHYRVVIPSEIAYGPAGSGRIPPNATLVFEIELIEVLP